MPGRMPPQLFMRISHRGKRNQIVFSWEFFDSSWWRRKTKDKRAQYGTKLKSSGSCPANESHLNTFTTSHSFIEQQSTPEHLFLGLLIAKEHHDLHSIYYATEPFRYRNHQVTMRGMAQCRPLLHRIVEENNEDVPDKLVRCRCCYYKQFRVSFIGSFISMTTSHSLS